MLLPNNKKYLLYIKTAKTGGTSFIDYLNQIKTIKIFKRINNIRILQNVTENDIIMVTSDNISIFKKKYKEIFNNSYKIIISRNPYQKTKSCFNYHSKCKNSTIINLLKSKENLIYDSTKIDYKLKASRDLWNNYSLFTHFYLPQTHGLIENNKLIVDYIIRNENMKEDIDNLLKKIKVNTYQITLKHLNKTLNKKDIDLNNEEISLINDRFNNDFKYLNYKKIVGFD